MSLKKDYYQTLQLSQTATQQQIKKSFRKLAVKWHPDKNIDNKQSATEKFKEISEAYETLSDHHKKTDYDRYGHHATSQFTSAEDVFSKFFSSFGFESNADEEYFGMRYGSDMYFKKKPKYYTDSPTVVGNDYKNVFKGYYGSGGSGFGRTGAYGGTLFGGMGSVGGGRAAGGDIPGGNVWSPAGNSTVGGSSGEGGYYYDYSKGYGGFGQEKYPYHYGSTQQPQSHHNDYSSLSTNSYKPSQGSVSKQVEKITSQIDGKKVITTKTKVYNKDGSQTITEIVQTEGQEKTQKVYKIHG